MNVKRPQAWRPTLCALALLVTACSGGSDETDSPPPAANRAPEAIAAPGSVTVVEGGLVTLDGRGSTDPDGDALSFAWAHVSGPAPHNPGASNAAEFSFSAPQVDADATLTIELRVTDPRGLSDTALVEVQVRDSASSPPTNHAPAASIVPATLTVDEGAEVTLDGSGSVDAEDGTALDYAWRHVSGPAPAQPSATDAAQFQFVAPEVTGQQVMVIELRVTDSGGLSDTMSAQITVRDTTPPPPTDEPPVANAGDDQTVSSGATVVLDGSASSDAEDGSALGFEWTQADGPSVTLNNADSAVASFSAPQVSAPTALRFRLTVTDSADQSAADETLVTVTPPAGSTTFLQGQCLDQGGPETLCTLLGLIENSQPDRLPLASYAVPRGSLVRSAIAARTPSAKSIDGAVTDWIGAASCIGGTVRYDAGEWIYTDYVFDAWGADDGDDAQRLALLDPLADAEPRTFRFDQLFQAAGDQFDAPRPIGAPDHYGDATDLSAEADLYELRLAADTQNLYLLARFATLIDPARPALLVLIDNADDSGSQAVGFDSGLSTDVFETAVLLTADGVVARDLASGDELPTTGAVTAINAAGWSNAFEAALPLSLFQNARRIAVIAGPRSENGLTPANVAYRFAEPVAGIYSDKLQALSLLAGNIDAFAAPLSLPALRGGVTETVRPGPGYHERQFISGENISREEGEHGRVQHYGLFVPTAYTADAATLSPLTFWLHYRGGKAHSGAAWTPRLITQLGEEQGNLVVTPRGRGTSTWYVTQAHQDFFEVFADVHALIPNIDAQRRYLSGYSMGGYGTYLFGLLYPDLFAAGYSTSGAVTQGAWTGLGPNDQTCQQSGGEIPGVGEATSPCFIEANSGDANAQLNYRLLENARHFPLVIHHGSNDELVPITGVQRMGARLAELGYRYDLSMFYGYEHFTQAIIDEWADGAAYLNRFTAPVNPRAVRYKIVPALVRALNTVQSRDVAFAFNPDGAYWVDGLAVSEPDPADPTQSGEIEAESFAIAQAQRIPVPRAGDIDPGASPPQVGTPLLSPGAHTTPFARHGLDWIDGPALATANAFSARLTRLSAASLDLARMNLDFGAKVTGTVDSSTAATLTLTGIDRAVQVFVNGIARSGALSGDRIVLDLAPGSSLIELLPPGALPPLQTGTGSPTLDAACAETLGASALCSGIAAASSAFVDGCGDFASPQFCATIGGNLHGLIDACREQAGSDGELVCKLAEQFVFGIASACRAQGLPESFCALVSGELIAQSAIAGFEQSWVARALSLQRALGDTLPLRDSEFLSTHNSYNVTTANTPQTLSGSDSNQKYSMPDQFRLGVRGIEIDVHWWFSAEGTPETEGRAPLLCHGNVFHFGCTTERPLHDGLIEIRDWLQANPDEVIVVDLEDNMNEPIDDALVAHDTAAATIDEVLGDLLYKPATEGGSCADGMPVDISREDILAAGRQAIIYSGCGAGEAWPQLMWQRRFHSQNSISGLGSATIAFPDQCVFTPEQFRDHWTRLYEDSTLVGAATGAVRRITADEVREMNRCGINMPSLDQVGPNDARLASFVWSWAPAQPDENDALDCASHDADGRFSAADCATPLPQACVNATGDWAIGLPAGGFATPACPAGYVFAVPRGSAENERLNVAKTAAGVSEVWLNYSDAATEGAWRASP